MSSLADALAARASRRMSIRRQASVPDDGPPRSHLSLYIHDEDAEDADSVYSASPPASASSISFDFDDFPSPPSSTSSHSSTSMRERIHCDDYATYTFDEVLARRAPRESTRLGDKRTSVPKADKHASTLRADKRKSVFGGANKRASVIIRDDPPAAYKPAPRALSIIPPAPTSPPPPFPPPPPVPALPLPAHLNLQRTTVAPRGPRTRPATTLGHAHRSFAPSPRPYSPTPALAPRVDRKRQALIFSDEEVDEALGLPVHRRLEEEIHTLLDKPPPDTPRTTGDETEEDDYEEYEEEQEEEVVIGRHIDYDDYESDDGFDGADVPRDVGVDSPLELDAEPDMPLDGEMDMPFDRPVEDLPPLPTPGHRATTLAQELEFGEDDDPPPAVPPKIWLNRRPKTIPAQPSRVEWVVPTEPIPQVVTKNIPLISRSQAQRQFGARHMSTANECCALAARQGYAHSHSHSQSHSHSHSHSHSYSQSHSHSHSLGQSHPHMNWPSHSRSYSDGHAHHHLVRKSPSMNFVKKAGQKLFDGLKHELKHDKHKST